MESLSSLSPWSEQWERCLLLAALREESITLSRHGGGVDGAHHHLRVLAVACGRAGGRCRVAAHHDHYRGYRPGTVYVILSYVLSPAV
jgi:hypothetical protein